MRLRFVEDRRTLLFAFVLFPLVPTLAYLRPELTLWLAPASLYLSYSVGVLTHNHNHCPVFVGRRANAFYAAWLSFFYGFPSFSWIPTHNQNHHRYLNGEGDATRTTRHSENDTLFALLTYPLASAGYQWDGIQRYVRTARTLHPERHRRVLVESAALVLGHACLFALGVGLHGLGTGTLVYAVSVGAPALLAPYFMMFTNYIQHVGCDPQSPDDHSRNFTSRFFNWFVFDNGLHTVHHEHPGVHWSRYRGLHDARSARIAPHLNQSSPFAFVARRYFVDRLVCVFTATWRRATRQPTMRQGAAYGGETGRDGTL
jgi:fatty acid desaturase